jgi:hypothetical protein
MQHFQNGNPDFSCIHKEIKKMAICPICKKNFKNLSLHLRRSMDSAHMAYVSDEKEEEIEETEEPFYADESEDIPEKDNHEDFFVKIVEVPDSEKTDPVPVNIGRIRTTLDSGASVPTVYALAKRRMMRIPE